MLHLDGYPVQISIHNIALGIAQYYSFCTELASQAGRPNRPEFFGLLLKRGDRVWATIAVTVKRLIVPEQ